MVSDTLILVIFGLFFLVVILAAVAFGICIYLYAGIIKDTIVQIRQERIERARAEREARKERKKFKREIDNLDFI